MAEKQRKLAAIMFTDIVSYTAIMSKDESKALLVLQKMRDILKPLIQKFNGEFLKEIGDGTLSSFNSVVEAVNCAIEIQRCLRDVTEFNIRIGIHIGDIVISEGDIFGDGVNIASRIEHLADPGGICISEKVYDDIRNKPGIEAVFFGEKTLKNVDHPIKVYGLSAEGLSVPARQVELERKKRRWAIIAAPLGVILIILGFLFILPFIFEQELVSDPKPITVISFKNQTGDNAYDYLQEAIPNLLITSLEQSRYLRVTTWERMYDLLKQMGKENVELIDADIGFELCRMDGINAIVLGSYTKAENIFVTDIKILDVHTKKLLKSVSSRGEGIGSILEKQIDELSKKIIGGVGIPENRIEEDQRPITNVTTTSIDAYNYYLRGRTDFEKVYYEDARHSLMKAVQLDSTFAAAYFYLAETYYWLRNPKARNDAYKKAKAFSEKATDKEKLYIEAYYARRIEGNDKKWFQFLNRIAEKYPKEKRVHHSLGDYYKINELYHQAIEEYNKALELDPSYGLAMNLLAYSYLALEDFEKAIEYFERYASISPGDANPFDSLAEVYFQMGRFDDAIEKYKEALKIKPDWGADWRIAYIYALKEDYTEAMKWIDQYIAAASSRSVRAEGYLWRGFYLYWLGSMDQSLIELLKIENLTKAEENAMWKAFADWIRGQIYYDKEVFELSGRYFKKWYDFFVESYPQYIPRYKTEYNFYLGLLALKGGRIDSARSSLTEMKSLTPDIYHQFRKDWIKYEFDLLYREVLLAEDSLEQVLDICKELSPLGRPPPLFTWHLLPYNVPFLKDVLARTYRQKRELDKGIAEYEWLITFDPDRKERCLIHPKYYYRLAKLYEDKDWPGKAIEKYEKFLEIWKDPDEELPQPHDARKRLARLKGEK